MQFLSNSFLIEYHRVVNNLLSDRHHILKLVNMMIRVLTHLGTLSLIDFQYRLQHLE